MASTTTKNKNRPLYLNWRLWVIISLVFLIVALVVLAVVGPDALAAILTAAVAWITTSGVWGLIAKYIWPPLWNEIKETREEAKKANEKTDTNTESITFLRTQYESLGKQYFTINKMYEAVMNDLQQERAESKVVTAELRTQINTLIRQNQHQQVEMDRLKRSHQQEIAKLNEEIRLMGVEKSSDKEKIVKLESQIQQLHERVRELEEWGTRLSEENKRLEEENRQLKTHYGRRSTDKLGQMPDEAEARYKDIEQQQQQQETEVDKEQ